MELAVVEQKVQEEHEGFHKEQEVYQLEAKWDPLPRFQYHSLQNIS